MYRWDLTDIRSQPALPPETLQTEYIYDPMPAELIPPTGSNLLVHFFEHPTHAGVLPDLYRPVPKRLREKLSPCPQRAARSAGASPLSRASTKPSCSSSAAVPDLLYV
ncbi:uncharacterized protein PG986_012404 [Apiospora aurea]|uniref:Uncharacterized protein n=1 Tax=Apiospora aurea TaxID=335848 RepID=A0ABR1PZV7_9PEZI